MKDLFAYVAVATIVKSFVLFLATGTCDSTNGRFLFRSAHFR